jgi:hypothetical protein
VGDAKDRLPAGPLPPDNTRFWSKPDASQDIWRVNFTLELAALLTITKMIEGLTDAERGMIGERTAALRRALFNPPRHLEPI